MPTDRPAPQPLSRHFESCGLKLHYLDWGNAGAPMVLLFHGSRDHARSWDWTARDLCDRYHVLAVDLRGHGDSAWSPDGSYMLPYHLEDMVRWLAELGSAPLSLVAHSFGGNLAVRLSAMYPERVRRLVVVDGLGPSPSTYDSWHAKGEVERARFWVQQRLDPKHHTPRLMPTIEVAIERMAAANPNLTPEWVRHLAEHGVRRAEGGWTWKYDPLSGLFNSEDFAVRIDTFSAQVQQPTLLCYGPKSWNSDPEEDGRAQHFRNRRSVIFERSGHWVHHDQFEEFSALLQDFLAPELTG